MVLDFFETTIGDQIILQRGFDITKKEQIDGNIPVVSSGGISSFHNQSKVDSPGVVLGRKGTLGSVYFLKKPFWPHDTTLWVKDFKGNDPQFVYYFFLSISEILKSMDVGAANPALNRNHVHPMVINWPNKTKQKAIAHILGTLDNKIELNRQMNQTLEAMAQALFKSWFVDFDPVLDNALEAGNKIPNELQARAEKRRVIAREERPRQSNHSASKRLIDTNPSLAVQFPDSFVFNETLGKWIPEGWEVKSLGSSAETVLGGTPSTKNESYWTNGTIGWLNSGKVNEFRILQPTQFITEDALNNSATKLMPVGTTLLAITGATLGQISRIEKQFCANQSVVGIIGNKYLSNEFIYLWIHQNIHFLTQNATGGAQQHVNKNNVNELQILLPPQQLRDSLNQEVFSMFTKIAINCSEIEILTELRDRLLPELISGRVRVAEGMLNPKNKQ